MIVSGLVAGRLDLVPGQAAPYDQSITNGGHRLADVGGRARPVRCGRCSVARVHGTVPGDLSASSVPLPVALGRRLDRRGVCARPALSSASQLTTATELPNYYGGVNRLLERLGLRHNPLSYWLPGLDSNQRPTD
jgi:hypothetical protein